MVAVCVRVEVAFAVTEAFLIAVGVAQVIRYLLLRLLCNRLERVEVAERRVRFGRRGEVERGLREVEVALRQAHAVEGRRRGLDDSKRAWVGEADVFAS